MTERLASIDGYLDFISEINSDPEFSDPMNSTDGSTEERLRAALTKKNDLVLGVRSGSEVTGIFVFLVLEDEKYLEMLLGLCRSREAAVEVFSYLDEHFGGFRADLVFNPRNSALRGLLAERDAFFYPVQLKMRFTGDVPESGFERTERFSEKYRSQYLAMHSKDCYWTGEKVLEKPERFSVFLAFDGGEVAGYTDVTNSYDENEPVAVFVREDRRRRGLGRELVLRALYENSPRGMSLLVDEDNAPAIALYRSVGFTPVPGAETLTAVIAKL